MINLRNYFQQLSLNLKEQGTNVMQTFHTSKRFMWTPPAKMADSISANAPFTDTGGLPTQGLGREGPAVAYGKQRTRTRTGGQAGRTSRKRRTGTERHRHPPFAYNCYPDKQLRDSVEEKKPKPICVNS